MRRNAASAELPYRVISLCAGDVGFGSAKTYDLEFGCPRSSAIARFSSCSNCRILSGEASAGALAKPRRRANPNWCILERLGRRRGPGLVAILENFQQEDASVAVPPALAPYMGGVTVLS